MIEYKDVSKYLDNIDDNKWVEVLDPKIKSEFDAVGNRGRVVSTYHEGLNGTIAFQGCW